MRDSSTASHPCGTFDIILTMQYCASKFIRFCTRSILYRDAHQVFCCMTFDITLFIKMVSVRLFIQGTVIAYNLCTVILVFTVVHNIFIYTCTFSVVHNIYIYTCTLIPVRTVVRLSLYFTVICCVTVIIVTVKGILSLNYIQSILDAGLCIITSLCCCMYTVSYTTTALKECSCARLCNLCGSLRAANACTFTPSTWDVACCPLRCVLSLR